MTIIDNEHQPSFQLNDHVFTFFNDKIMEGRITRFPEFEPHEWNIYLVEPIGNYPDWMKPMRLLECQIFQTKKECIEHNIKLLNYEKSKTQREIDEKYSEINHYDELITKLNMELNTL